MDYRVRLVIETIQRDLVAPLDVQRLAAIAGISPSGLRAIFRRSLGLSPHRFVKKLRLDSARVRLTSETASVKEIMASVGYSDPSHFVRDFERAYGLSPVRFRRSLFKNTDDGDRNRQ